MSGGRRSPSHAAGSLSVESSRFVPKVNETLRLAPYQVAFIEVILRARHRARVTFLRRQLLAQVALDRERGLGRAEQVLTPATA